MPDQLCPAQHIKVLIVLPELEVLALALVAGNFVQDSQISRTVVGCEVGRDFLKQFELVLSQVFEPCQVLKVEVRKAGAFSLNRRGKKSNLWVHSRLLIKWLAKVPNLVLLEAGDEGPLVLIENQLGYELADPLHVEEFADVDLVSQLFLGFMVPLQSLLPSLVPG